ncbi:MarR family winged helix-turn-helix transcriptional regulator [Pedococcus sp. 5OH_020]|uniref:MarR family winged helix-turn-helix transcriptional regulator n=1 Tax=Pedococcus sp. 5OH_020 TaxID=2989814 RepID=UPI0022E9DEBF|nr:MarR family transcriptional regulator [Pedococcus sp. 5OH_020]
MTVSTGARTTTRDVVSALSSLIRASRSAARQRQVQLGASGTALAILKALSYDSALDRPGDLAQATGVAPSVVSRALARLEDDGLVERTRDDRDARACHISLTEEGRRQLETVEQEYVTLLDDALTELSDEDVQRLPGLLTLLEHSIRRAGERATAPRRLTMVASLTDHDPHPLHHPHHATSESL